MVWDPVSRWLRRRPMVLAALCLVLGMLLGRKQAVPWPVWLICLLLCGATAVTQRRAVWIHGCVALMGALLMTLSLLRPPLPELGRAQLTGRLISEPRQSENSVRLLLDQVRMDGEELPTRVMAYVYGDELPPLEYGAILSMDARLSLPAGVRNPGGYDFSAYLWRQGAAASASASGVEVLSPAPFSLPRLLSSWRQALQRGVERAYPPQIAPLVSALVLGERSQLPEELLDSFRGAGVAHLLAISGLHVSCLAFALEFLLRRLRCPARASFFLVAALLGLYALVVGLPISVLRAILMYVLASGARLLGRPSDRLTGLGAALMLILLIRPLSLEDPSLILSFTSVAGILSLFRLGTPSVFYHKSRAAAWLETGAKWIGLSLLASLAAQLGSLPAVACLFGEIPVYSLFTNLPVLPLMTLALPVAMLSLGLTFLFPPLGQALSTLVSWWLASLIRLTGWVSGLPFSSLSTPAWPLCLILGYALLWFLASPMCSLSARRRRLCLACMPLVGLCALALPLTYPTHGLEALFLDVGQGDGALLRAENQYYLMDVGDGSTVADYLRVTGIRPRAVFLSHPHRDHVGGLAKVVELCPPGVVYLPCLWDEVPADPGVPEALDLARQAGWRVEYLRAGDTLALSPAVSLETLQPWPGMTDNANGASLVARVSINNRSILFTGDLPSAWEVRFFPDCDVLKVAHHGADASTSRLFLQMTSPSVAVISVGRNGYGHPADATLERLEDVAVYRTDQRGAVRVRIGEDGQIQVTPMRTPEQAQNEGEAAA